MEASEKLYVIDPGKANTSSIHKIIRYVFIVPVITGLLSIFYTIVFSGFSKDSDCISVYLQGLDMGAGNWRLSHFIPIHSCSQAGAHRNESITSSPYTGGATEMTFHFALPSSSSSRLSE